MHLFYPFFTTGQKMLKAIKNGIIWQGQVKFCLFADVLLKTR